MTKPVCQCGSDYDPEWELKRVRCPLCAAASDLYAACEALVKEIDDRYDVDTRPDGSQIANISIDIMDAVDVCRAAIAKARGEGAK